MPSNLSVYDQQLTQQQQAQIQAYKDAYNTAKAAGDKAGMSSAHSAAEAVRSGSGYSGGLDGSQYIGLPKGTAPTVPSAVLPSASSAAAQINNYNQAYIDAATSALQAAYDENINIISAAQEKIPGVYQEARNQSAASGELARRNMNEYMTASGLNSGTAGQASLAMSNAVQNSIGNINRGEADAISELTLQRTQLDTSYKNDIAKAIAQGNLQKAQMLYEDYVRVDNSLVQTALNQAQLGLSTYGLRADAYNTDYSNTQNALLIKAQTLAKYGDFSAYAALGYTPEQIASMKQAWDAAQVK